MARDAEGMDLQAYFGDIVDSVPDHCRKVSITIKQVMNFLISQCICKLCLHCTIFYKVCNSIMSKNCAYLD